MQEALQQANGNLERLDDRGGVSNQHGLAHRRPVLHAENYDGVQRNLALELVRVTEAAALSAGHHFGRGDKIQADQAAVDSMRKVSMHLQLSS